MNENQHEITIGIQTYLFTKKGSGIYDISLYVKSFGSYELFYEDLTSSSESYNDEMKDIIKKIKELNKKEKLDNMKYMQNTSLQVGRDYYPLRLDPNIVADLKRIRLEHGIVTVHFVNNAIKEKLDRDSL
jgi:hypothetical protein